MNRGNAPCGRRSEESKPEPRALAHHHQPGRLVAGDDPLPGLVSACAAAFGLGAVSVLRRTVAVAGSLEAGAGVGAPLRQTEGRALDLGENVHYVIRSPQLPRKPSVLAAFVARLVAVRARALARCPGRREAGRGRRPAQATRSS